MHTIALLFPLLSLEINT